jgi:hypothetical protein
MNESECAVLSNCRNPQACWYCRDYAEYRPIDPKILTPLQLQRREERKAERKVKKASDAGKRGSRSKCKGYRGEHEIETLLPDAKRDFGRGARADVVWQGKKIEVKRRAAGFSEIYRWLKVMPGCGLQVKQGADAADYLMMRSDNMPWLMVRVLSADEMRTLSVEDVS